MNIDVFTFKNKLILKHKSDFMLPSITFKVICHFIQTNNLSIHRNFYKNRVRKGCARDDGAKILEFHDLKKMYLHP